MSKKINLELQWQKYLSLMEVKEKDLPEIQRIEMRRAFFGGMGQCLVLGKEVISLMNEKDQIFALQDMMNQVGAFWTAENSRLKKDGDNKPS